MLRKTELVIEKLARLYTRQLDQESLLMILKTQALVKEINSDADNA